MKLDSNETWRKLEDRLAREANPRLRRNLEVVLAHMKALVSARAIANFDRVGYSAVKMPP